MHHPVSRMQVPGLPLPARSPEKLPKFSGPSPKSRFPCGCVPSIFKVLVTGRRRARAYERCTCPTGEEAGENCVRRIETASVPWSGLGGFVGRASFHCEFESKV